MVSVPWMTESQTPLWLRILRVCRWQKVGDRQANLPTADDRLSCQGMLKIFKLLARVSAAHDRCSRSGSLGNFHPLLGGSIAIAPISIVRLFLFFVNGVRRSLSRI
jgi:hypothetical protein